MTRSRGPLFPELGFLPRRRRRRHRHAGERPTGYYYRNQRIRHFSTVSRFPRFSFPLSSSASSTSTTTQHYRRCRERTIFQKFVVRELLVHSRRVLLDDNCDL